MLTRFKQTFCRTKRQREQQLQQQQQQQETIELQQCRINKSASVTFSAIAPSQSISNASSKRSCFAAKDIFSITNSTQLTNRNTPYTKTVIQQATPVLFSTNRGLHLRMHNTSNNGTIKNNATNNDKCNSINIENSIAEATIVTHNNTNSSQYTIAFCDLERWCTRANNLRLDDTFVLRSHSTDISHLPSVSCTSTTSASLSSQSSLLLVQMHRTQPYNDCSPPHHHQTNIHASSSQFLKSKCYASKFSDNSRI